MALAKKEREQKCRDAVCELNLAYTVYHYELLNVRINFLCLWWEGDMTFIWCLAQKCPTCGSNLIKRVKFVFIGKVIASY